MLKQLIRLSLLLSLLDAPVLDHEPTPHNNGIKPGKQDHQSQCKPSNGKGVMLQVFKCVRETMNTQDKVPK